MDILHEKFAFFLYEVLFKTNLLWTDSLDLL